MISNKLIGLAALVLLCGSAGFSAVGCSSSDDDAADDDDDGGTTSGGTSGGSSGKPQPSSSGNVSSSGGAGDAPACFDEDSTATRNGAGPAAHQNKCTDAALQEFLDKCLTSGDADGGEEETDAAADAGTPCDAFIDANKDCATCILPEITVTTQEEYNAAPYGVMSLTDDNRVSLDIASCIAGLATADDACKKSYVNRIFCAQQTCGTCEEADSDACFNYALGTESSCEEAAPVTEECATAVNAVTEDQIKAACGDTTNDEFDALYLKIGKTRCGQ